MVYFWGIGKKKERQKNFGFQDFIFIEAWEEYFLGSRKKKRKTQEIWCSGFYPLRSLGGKSQVFPRVGFSLIFNLTICSYIFVDAYLYKFV